MTTATDTVQKFTREELEDTLLNEESVQLYDEVLTKYFGGEAQATEVVETFRLIDSDPQNYIDPPSVSFAAGFVAALAVLEKREQS